MTPLRAAMGRGVTVTILLLVTPAHAEPLRQLDTRAQFSLFDPGYAARIRPIRRRVAALAQAVAAGEAAGRPARCAEEQLTELRWRSGNTADYAVLEAAADRLAALIDHPDPTPEVQDPADGSWGRCFTEWFFRLDSSYDAISELDGRPPPVPPRFLDRVNGADALQRYIEAVETSDIAATGVDHRREYNLALSDLMRLVLREQPAGYRWDPALAPRLRALILGPLRDGTTGFWGPTYVIGGRPVRVPDLSITFHVVKYLGGDVPDWPKIIGTLLAMRSLRYPQGWTQDRGFLAHDLYDVATLFRLGWPRADAAQKAAISTAMGDALTWCLDHTVHPDGSVTVDGNDDSIETATYFAVALLDELGVFDPAKRFWTDAPLPDSAALAVQLRARIAAALATGAAGEGGSYYRAALARLDGR